MMSYTESESKAWDDGLRAGMNAASAMLGVTEDEIRLACGELTPQEMRTVKAILSWRKAAIERRAGKIWLCCGSYGGNSTKKTGNAIIAAANKIRDEAGL